MSQDQIEQDCIRYREAYPVFARAAASVAEELRQAVRQLGTYGSVTHRAKDPESFVKKAFRKEGYANDLWMKTTDKAGARVILADPTQLYPLLDYLSAVWAERLVEPPQDKTKGLELDQFNYSGIHLQVVVPGEETDGGEQVECEVQLRTAAQDAWAMVDHQYVYKSLVTASDESKRRMYRLVAVMELFDEEVKRTVQAVVEDPQYAHAKLVQDVERAFYRLNTWAFDRVLTAEVVQLLLSAVPEAERAAYGDELFQFVEQHAESLEKFFAKREELGHLPRYALLTQPEALLLIERSERAELLLEEAVASAGMDLRRMIEPVLAVWGKPLPEWD